MAKDLVDEMVNAGVEEDVAILVEMYFSPRKASLNNFSICLISSIIFADMHNRRKLWYIYPDHVNAIMVYEGHEPFKGVVNLVVSEQCHECGHMVDAKDLTIIKKQMPVKSIRKICKDCINKEEEI